MDLVMIASVYGEPEVLEVLDLEVPLPVRVAVARTYSLTSAAAALRAMADGGSGNVALIV
jgi:hypothetical protein